MDFNENPTDLVLNKANLQIWKVEKYSYKGAARPDHGFLYLSKGRLTYTFGDCVLAVKPGDIVYLPKGSKYDVEFDVRSGAVEDILINFDVVSDREFAETKDPVCFYNDRSGRLRSYFIDVVNAYYEKKKSFFTNMQLYRCMNALQEVLADAEDEALSQLRQGAAMLSENLELTVDEICEVLHVSRSSFQKRFKAYFGTAPAAYRLEKKIEKAKLLLETTDIPIKEIVVQLRFYDTAYFYRVFERRTSLTPGQYRVENRPCF